jgi:hypothetical protein
MHTYTLLFQDHGAGGSIRAISFTAPSAHQAVLLLQQLPIRDRCELWTEGRYVCSLSLLGGRTGWCTVSLDEPPAEVVQIEAQIAD